MEVAGLVLGALPVAVAAFQTYEFILSVGKFKVNLKPIVWQLNNERAILQNTCELLLKDIVPGSELDSLVANPLASAGHLAQYNDDVRFRLYKCYDEFQQCVSEMHEAVVDLRRKLAINEKGETKILDRSSIMAELKRGTHFTLKHKSYNTILSRLKDGNSALTRLIAQSAQLAPSRRSRSQAKLAVLVRDISRGIYTAFKRAMTCNCDHQIGLEMVPRKNDILPDCDEGSIITALHFALVVKCQAQQQERWDSIQIKPGLVETKLSSSPSSPLLNPKPQSISTVGRSVRWSPSTTILGRGQKPQVSFQGSSTVTVQTSPNSPVRLPSGPQSELITNLCSTLHKGNGIAEAAEAHCYGYVCEESHRFQLYADNDNNPLPDKLKFISLDVYLQENPDFSEFTYTERLKLALALSYGVLHLYQSPWLTQTVTVGDIVFTKEQEFPIRPFLTKAVVTSSCHSPQTQASTTTKFSRPIDLTNLSLGFLLIQIINGQHVQDLTIMPDTTIDSIVSKHAIALKQVGSVERNGGFNYANAVKWCLDGIGRVGSLDIDNYGADFHNQVIARLEEDWKTQSR